MRLQDLVKLIEKEAAMKARIDAELDEWRACDALGSPLRKALRAFGKGSLRKNAAALGVSPTYLSRCECGDIRPSRQLMVRVHNTFGVGAKDGD